MPRDEAEEPKEPKQEEVPKAEKQQILREAVSFYLRNDFRDAKIRAVCEEFIASVDDSVRAAVAQESGSTRHSASAPLPQHNKKS